MIKGRLNNRGIRIVLSMIACLVTFSVATIVTSANTNPGVEYKSYAEEVGWGDWVRNGEESGDSNSLKMIKAFKMLLTDVDHGGIKYSAYEVGSGWKSVESDGVLIECENGVQGIKIVLFGKIEEQYSVYYRVHMIGGDWTQWVKDTEIAGDISGTAAIDSYQVVLKDKQGNAMKGDATDYSVELPALEGQQDAQVQQTDVVRGNKQETTSSTTEKQKNETAQVNQETQKDGTQVTNSEQTTEDSKQEDSQASKLISKLINVAKNEVGYKPDSSGATKYGQWWANRVNDKAFVEAKWSSMFLAWCGEQAGLKEEQYGYYACSQYWTNWFKDNNAYHSRDGYTPKAGDIIFMDYDNNQESDHNGLVEKVDSKNVYTIEGNVDGETKECKYSLTDSSLMGYGTPLYDKTVENNQDDKSNDSLNDKSNDSINDNNNETALTKLSSSITGIDVSKFNGAINWSKVKNSEAKFTMVRLGGRATGGSLYTDSKFNENMQAANAQGIDAGVYFFTQAITTEEAIEEANYVLDKVKNYNLKYPIAIDCEKSPSGTRTDNLSKNKRTEIVKAFCDKIKAAGYKAQIYSGKFYFREKFNMDSLSGYDIWLAHYTKGGAQTDFTYTYSIWQYTDRGSISGISGSVDMNKCYVKY